MLNRTKTERAGATTRERIITAAPQLDIRSVNYRNKLFKTLNQIWEDCPIKYLNRDGGLGRRIDASTERNPF